MDVVTDHFVLNSFAPPFSNLSFNYKLAEVPGVAPGILKIELKQKLIIYLAYVISKGIHKFPY